MKIAGVGPEKTHWLFCCLNNPEGIDVPGLTACGSVIQRSTQSGFNRSLANRKFGAVAILSCAGSPVAWHFRQGAAVLENKLRAMSVSFALSVGTCSGMYGIGCCDNAWKNLTNFRSSLSENENVGMRTFKYGRTPFRFVSVVLSAGFDRNFRNHSGSTRAPSVSSFGGSCSCTS